MRKSPFTWYGVTCLVLPFLFINCFISEVLTLGLPDDNGHVVLLEPTMKVPNNAKLF